MTSSFHLSRMLTAFGGVLATAFLLTGPAEAQGLPPAPKGGIAKLSPADAAIIVATVNGEAITLGDVDSRRRLFALSAGLPMTGDVLARLTPQVTNQLIDERLKLKEILRRELMVPDQAIAASINNVEQRNGMAPGTLKRRLATDGVALRTMIDQIRVQIGWSEVVRAAVGVHARISEADIKQREEVLRGQIGQTEYLMGEIFVAVANPARADEAQGFANTVIEQLRGGAPFQVIAAQFSQSQTALQGGDLGWVQAFELDPAVQRVLDIMPAGAVSNPIPVAGGLSIVTLRGKRQIGREQATVLDLRQVIFRFADKLNHDNPTAQQREMLDKAQKFAAGVHDCAGMEAAAKANGDENGGNPGEVRLEAVPLPQLRQMMATLPIGKASQPLLADDGAAVMMICSREAKTIELPSKREIGERILSERVEVTSRQLLRDLQRHAVIDRRR